MIQRQAIDKASVGGMGVAFQIVCACRPLAASPCVRGYPVYKNTARKCYRNVHDKSTKGT